MLWWDYYFSHSNVSPPLTANILEQVALFTQLFFNINQSFPRDSDSKREQPAPCGLEVVTTVVPGTVGVVTTVEPSRPQAFITVPLSSPEVFRFHNCSAL